MSSPPIATDVKVVTGQHHCDSAACQQRRNEANTSSLRTRNGTSTESDPQIQNMKLLFDTLSLRGDALHADIPYSEPTPAVIPSKMDNQESTGSQQPVVSFDFRVVFQLGKVATRVKDNNRKQNEILLKQEDLARKQEDLAQKQNEILLKQEDFAQKQEDLAQKQDFLETTILRVFDMQKYLLSEFTVLKRALVLLHPDQANILYPRQRPQPPPQNFQ
ncbi:hypothetical protein TWF192_005724 [Orbilia oligospora]|uniref:Uncharacterized protein n=1 Tax=Orbilia oligospora TaxID=2813651 RepID=A0A6G1MNM5_ORBOL|nr:hypothetical protein TWF191_003915 [Orbilia oligospora]KAF3263443.1 hypothetical protein TWF192_005724 [Orbilia oligospora]